MRTNSRKHAATLAVVALGSAGLGIACGGDESSAESGPPELCVSTREYFTTEVYGKAMQPCLACHLPGGTAEQKGAKFKIYNTTWPDFVTANIESIRDYSKLEIADTPVLLLKPLGERDHGGGAVLKEDSPEYRTLSKFINDLRSGEEKRCDSDGQLGVQLMSNEETARKAAILLAGTFPSDQDLASVATPEGLDAYVIKLTETEAFYDLLREIWNDALLTERGVDASIGGAFFNAPYLYDDNYPQYYGDNRNLTSVSLTQEPMRFIEYVVRNNLPFTDVVTGNYLVANPFTARTYGVPHDGLLAADGFLDWRRIDYAPVQNQSDGQNQPLQTYGLPVAGVLTTPSFLMRWETTPTNRGRKRARIVLKNFLATDIFKFGTRPVDSTALTSVQNPTLNSAQCVVCHDTIDPIAGGFRGFGEQQLLRFDADDKWHDDLLPPGINGVDMPPQSYGSAIMWTGAQIAKDRRFAISVAQVMYRGIIGDEVNPFPTDKNAPDYTERVRAYNIQNDWIVKIGDEFAASKYDLRKLVAAIVKSTYFRATSGDPSKDGLHEGLGQGRLLTPEMLGRKLKATTGTYYWAFEQARKDETRKLDGYLVNDLVRDDDWRLVYGGIDSGDTTKRTETMSPIMLATSQYVASIVACRAVSYDFTKPVDQRRLFKTVNVDTVPYVRPSKTEPISPVGEAEKRIRDTIVYLYFRLLGERHEAGSEEVTQLYRLFADTWRDLEDFNFQNPTAGGTNLSNGRCVAENDWDKGVTFQPRTTGGFDAVYVKLADRGDLKTPYQPGMQIRTDENFTIRSWQAVLTYLLTDYRFTHE
jgi:hypothetical protein